MAVALGDIDIALAVKTHLVRRVELGLPRPSSVARMSLPAVPCHDRYLARCQPQYPMAAEFGPSKRTVRPEQHTERLIELGGGDGFAVGGETLCAGACHSDDAFGGWLAMKR